MNTDQTSCGEVREKLPLYVGEDLDPEVLDAVRMHLDRCLSCARMAESAARARKALISAFRGREADGARPGLWPGIRSALRAEGRIHEASIPVPLAASKLSAVKGPRTHRSWRVRTLVPLTAAAALLALVQLGGLFATDPSGRIRPADLDPELAPVVVVPVSAPRPSGTLRRVAPGESGLRALYRRPRDNGAASGEGDISLADFK